MKAVLLKILLIGISLMLIPHALAQFGDTQIRQQRDRDKQELEQASDLAEVNTAIELLDEYVPGNEEGAACFDIETLELQGASLLKKSDLKPLENMVEGRCVGLPQLSLLIKRITNIYIIKGYVTTRAYVPEQDLRSGTLEILIIEGQLENISADELADINLVTAFPGLSGKFLNLRDIEQGLAQINRLQSNDASMTLEPGSEPGLTSIAIHNTPSNPWSSNFSWDNFDGTHASKINGSVGFDNALGINDYSSLRVRRDTEFDDANYNQNLSFNEVIPFGRWTYSLLFSKLKYQNTLDLENSTVESRGVSKSWYLNADRLLHRTPSSRLSMASSLSHRDTRNYINELFIDVSSRKTSVLNMGVNGRWNLGGLRLSSALNVNKGLEVFDAEKDPSSLADEAPKAQFLSYGARLNIDGAVELGNLKTNLSTSIAGQYTKDALYGSEFFTVGGFSAVRGVNASAAASRGAVMRNQWSVLLPHTGVGGLDEAFQNLFPRGILHAYLAYDLGQTNGRFDDEKRIYSSWSVGLTGSWKDLNFDMIYSRPIRTGGSSFMENSTVYSSLTYQF